MACPAPVRLVCIHGLPYRPAVQESKTMMRSTMADHTYSISELVGTSSEGVDAAIKNAVAEAHQTLRNLDWFEVKEIRGHLENGEVADWQGTIKIGFRHERK